MSAQLLAPYPYFGGKRDIAPMIWSRLGRPKHYIEPFCGSCAVLLAAPEPASLEVVGDANGFIANFWRATVHQPGEVARWADYPVSHVDLGARHGWLMDQRGVLGAELQDPNWPGNAKVAGWWLWGQCCWIGSGWCDWDKGERRSKWDQRPHITTEGMGIHARQRRREGDSGDGTGADVTSAGMPIQAAGKVPHVSDAGRGIQATGQVPHVGNADPCFWTSSGAVADRWLRQLAARLERVRVVHGDWSRCLNSHYGGDRTAIFFDPPYESFEGLYGVKKSVAQDVATWCRENQGLAIALSGHVGDYDLPGWDAVQWERSGNTYSGSGTKDLEMIWFSPACLPAERPKQASLFV